MIGEHKTCPACKAAIGNKHGNGCDVERCANCGAQEITCGCDAHNLPPQVWTGKWPGIAECEEFGWFVKRDPTKGWVPCGANEPDAVADLNRLMVEAEWSKEQGRFVLRGQ